MNIHKTEVASYHDNLILVAEQDKLSFSTNSYCTNQLIIHCNYIPFHIKIIGYYRIYLDLTYLPINIYAIRFNCYPKFLQKQCYFEWASGDNVQLLSIYADPPNRKVILLCNIYNYNIIYHHREMDILRIHYSNHKFPCIC